MNRRHPRTRRAAVGSLALGLALTGCAGGEGNSADEESSKPSATPHGYVEGAEEAAEQQSRLVLADAGTGKVRVLDLVEDETHTVGSVQDPESLHTDGRFAYANSPAQSRVFDSGAWMVDHGDHVHYYRAEIEEIGAVRGKRPEHVHSSTALTAVTFGDGTAKLLDRKKLEDGDIDATATLDDADGGPVVPYGRHALTPRKASGGQTVVEARDRRGKRETVLDEECEDLRGAAVTRSGVVFGCADGALLVSERKGELAGEKIEFEESVSSEERPRSFRHRSMSTTLTARAGDRGIWVLDVADRSWKLLETGPAVAVNTAGEGTPVLALTESGVLKGYDPESGRETASRKLLAESPGAGSDGGGGAKPVIEVDTSRAYVNDPSAKKIHEIDYNDGLRTARSFSPGLSPTHMVETGR